MKKVFIIITFITSFMISFFMTGCGANATKPEDLKESVYDEETGKANSSTIQAAAGTAITVDSFGTIDATPVIVTDAAVYQSQSDGTLKDVTASKEIADGYLYSITPSVSGDVIISYTYRKPDMFLKTVTVDEGGLKEKEGLVLKSFPSDYQEINIDDIQDLQAVNPKNFKFTAINYVIVDGNNCSYLYEFSGVQDGQYRTNPELNAVTGSSGGNFAKEYVSSFYITLYSSYYNSLEISVKYSYEANPINVQIPNLDPAKKGTLQGSSSGTPMVIEDASFKKGQIYYLSYSMNGNTAVVDGRIAEAGKITFPGILSQNDIINYQLWVF